MPYTGLYVIKGDGGAGQGCGSFRGGCGEVPPEHSGCRGGEQLTYAVGGQNGYNKGGRASNYGNGGGMTSVVSDRKGIPADRREEAVEHHRAVQAARVAAWKVSSGSRKGSGYGRGGAGYYGGNRRREDRASPYE